MVCMYMYDLMATELAHRLERILNFMTIEIAILVCRVNDEVK